MRSSAGGASPSLTVEWGFPQTHVRTGCADPIAEGRLRAGARPASRGWCPVAGATRSRGASAITRPNNLVASRTRPSNPGAPHEVAASTPDVCAVRMWTLAGVVVASGAIALIVIRRTARHLASP